jgi:hypothetical protein
MRSRFTGLRVGLVLSLRGDNASTQFQNDHLVCDPRFMVYNCEIRLG